MFDNHIFSNILSTKIFGKTSKYYPQLNSTNTKAWELVSQNAEDGTVVITNNQTKGRGRHSNKWYSTPNNSLTFSIILYPDTKPNLINFISLITGLAIRDYLTQEDINAQLKWPNDVLINQKKVSGILCESKISGGVNKAIVIGVGININNKLLNFPPEIQSKATSLFIESGQEYQLEIVLANILNILENKLNNLESIQNHIKDWENSCAHLNKIVHFNSGNRKVEGIFKGLSDNGQAIIELDRKDLYFESGEII